MARRYRIEVRRLMENDCFIYDGIRYRVIMVTSTHFDHKNVVICFSDYRTGVQRISFPTGAFVDVAHLIDRELV